MSKYHSKKVVLDGIEFDSKREAKRYGELLLLERAGAITDLQRQVRFELVPAQYETFERYGKRGKRLKDGKRCVEHSVTYVADFVYLNASGVRVVEDTKGYKKGTAYDVFAIKRKLARLNGIVIAEV